MLVKIEDVQARFPMPRLSASTRLTLLFRTLPAKRAARVPRPLRVNLDLQHRGRGGNHGSVGEPRGHGEC